MHKSLQYILTERMNEWMDEPIEWASPTFFPISQSPFLNLNRRDIVIQHNCTDIVFTNISFFLWGLGKLTPTKSCSSHLS